MVLNRDDTFVILEDFSQALFVKLTEETWVEIIDWKKLPLRDIQIAVSGKGNVVLSATPAAYTVRTLAVILTSSTIMHCVVLDRIQWHTEDSNTLLPSRGFTVKLQLQPQGWYDILLVKGTICHYGCNQLLFSVLIKLSNIWLSD